MSQPDDTARPAADELLGAAAQDGADRTSVTAELASAMVGMKKKYYGRGPTAAKAWILDDYVFVALEGGLTRNEETLLDSGKDEIVRSYRLAFQEAMTEVATTAVAEITGREVIGYHSQIVFRPTRAFEIFVLAPSNS